MQEAIRTAIEDALKTLGIEEVNFTVDHPTEKILGADYFSNVAMVISKKMSKAPLECAEDIRDLIVSKIPYIKAIGISTPGFINFYLDRSFFVEKLNDILSQGDTWGRNDSWVGKKVLVEYTDPNPFKEFHIGHLFTNAVGESIARLFIMNGADTKRVNYQGDVGLHVACAIWGLIEHYGDDQVNPHAANGYFYAPAQLGMAYAFGASAYKSGDESIVKKIKEINKAVYEKSDDKINEIYQNGRKSSLQYFEEIYAVVDTQFNEYFFESEAGPHGKELVLNNPDIFPESDGARIYDGEAKGLHTRVFLNKEGLPTYEAKELALAKLKDERFQGYDHSVISTANEINEYFKVLLSAMGEVYPDLAAKTEHVGHGMVRLATGKMSSRTGDVIPAVAFINEVADAAYEKMERSGGVADREVAQQVAIAAIKYATLRGSILQDSIFDKEKALSFEGDSGPYLQYTFARIQSVLEKASGAGVEGSTNLPPAEAYDVEKLVYQFPEVIATALNERAPHKVTTYLTELAGAFNSFYAVEKIADVNDEYAPYKIELSKAVALTLKNGLWTLGIKAPERM